MNRNFLYRQVESKNWDSLTDVQKAGIESAIYQLDQNKGISHEMVMEKMKKKYRIK